VTDAVDREHRQRDACERLLARETTTARRAVVLEDGTRLDYEIRAGFTPVTTGGIGADRDELRAAVFTISYSVVDPPGPRPVCFAINGGPGSPSIWLDFGALGPARIPVEDDGSMPPTPYAPIPNPLTWLEFFDLVFIDPPHTGLSLTASDAARKDAFSVDGDVDVLAETMRGWLAANGRFGAPLYYVGESYGTMRGAAIAAAMEGLGLGFAGVILASCAMDYQGLTFAPHNDLPYALFLPAFAATAEYHERVPGSIGGTSPREAASAFVEEYIGALTAGARLDDTRRERVAGRVSELTGLPVELVRERHLRIGSDTFFAQALRGSGRVVGRLDARVTAPAAAIRSESVDFDPALEAIMPPYVTAALSSYSALGIDLTDRHQVLVPSVGTDWNWSRRNAVRGGSFASTSDDLALAMRKNPHLRVFVASGYYDLATPFSVTEWSLAQMDAPRDVLARVTHRYYDAGHMMYTRPADLRKLRDDVAAWLSPAGRG
jgi:carboxypeptidase C (cathepsin A)